MTEGTGLGVARTLLSLSTLCDTTPRLEEPPRDRLAEEEYAEARISTAAETAIGSVDKHKTEYTCVFKSTIRMCIPRHCQDLA